MGNKTQLANASWEALLSAHASLMKEFQAKNIWAEADISMREYDVLYTLSKSHQALSINELNRQVLLSQPALSRMLDRLEQRGLIERQTDSTDRRIVHLSLTELGKERQRQVGRRHARDVSAAMADLDEKELLTLEQICKKLVGVKDHV